MQPVRYKDVLLDCGYRVDVLVENQLIIELKSIEQLLGIHEASFVDLYEIGGNQGWTANELQRNQTERRPETVRALISFVLFVSCVVR